MVYGVKYQSGKSDFNYGYLVGGQLEVRPYEKVSFITGYSYNKFKGIDGFSFVPALFNYYYAEKKSICAGPVLFFEQHENPYIGGIIGYKVEYFGLYFIYNPRLPIEETDDKIRVFLGLGLIIQLPIKII